MFWITYSNIFSKKNEKNLLCKGHPEFRKNAFALMKHVKNKVKVILLTTKPAFVRGASLFLSI